MITIFGGCRGRLSAGERQAATARTVPSMRGALRATISLALLLGSAAMDAGRAFAGGGTLIVAMTAGDIPVTTGNPDQGFEGYRFVGYNLYDALVL